MSSKPVLLFLHGVGSGDQDDRWKVALSESLSGIGYPDLDRATVIAPKYPHTLRGSDDDDPLPPITVKSPTGEAAARNRRQFERRMGAVEQMLGRHDPGTGWFAGDAVVSVAANFEVFLQANNYVRDKKIRAQVLNRVLKRLPSSGPLVIVGHSLGSVIAADLVRRLPNGVEVTGLITVGSPLAHGRFDVERVRKNLEQPPSNLAWWVNFWNDADPVTAHKGVSSTFPWMVDYRLRTPIHFNVHDAATYLSHQSAATAIGFGLFGSLSKSLATVDRGVDVSMDYAETVALLALRYAHLVADRLEGERRERFSEALRRVQASTVDLIKQRNAREGRLLPTAVARLAVDLTDPHSAAPVPATVQTLSKDDAVVPLLSIAAANVIWPFEIDVSKDARREAMQALTMEMGIGSQLGENVFKASDRARDVLKEGTNWIKWAALGLGAAALIAGTGGLALAAAPGVAGAAAVTSALAAFGPGGMIGGLLTAGTFVSAGGGGIAIGLASSTTAAASVEAVVASQLAAAVLRQLEGLDQDRTTFDGLVDLGTELRRQHSRLEPLSDRSSPGLKEIVRKLAAVDRAMAYLEGNGLAPDLGEPHED